MNEEDIRAQLEAEYDRVIKETLQKLYRSKPLNRAKITAALMAANKAYWTARLALLDNDAVYAAGRVSGALAMSYYYAAEDLAEQVQHVYAGYRSTFNLSQKAAKELLDKVVYDRPIAESLQRIADAMPAGEERNRILAEISAPAYRYRMQRAEQIAKNAQEACENIARGEIAIDRQFLQTEIEKAYNISLDGALSEPPSGEIADMLSGDVVLDRPVPAQPLEMPRADEPVQDFTPTDDRGIMDSFSVVSTDHAREIMENRWSGESFSERIWSNTEDLAQEVKQVILEGELTGASEAKMAAKIRDRFTVGMHEARRVVRTEHNYCINQAELKGMKDAGFDEYEFISLGEEADNVCHTCDDLDGERFKIEDAVVGVNCPPMHPFCRCKATTPMETKEDVQADIDRLLDGRSIEDIERELDRQIAEQNALPETVESTAEATQPESYSTLNSVQESAEKNTSGDLSKELTIDEKDNQYRKYELDKENPVTVSRTKEIQAYKVTNSTNNIYISSDAHVKPKQLHQIDMKVSEVYDLIGAANAENKPGIFIITGDEMATNSVAAYNVVTNQLFVANSVAIYKKDVTPDFMKAFACGSDDRSSYLHELYHWKDAQTYIKNHGEITNDNLNSYFEWVNNKSKKSLDKAIEKGYNISEMSKYAKKSFLKEDFAEAYTECRVEALIGDD